MTFQKDGGSKQPSRQPTPTVAQINQSEEVTQAEEVKLPSKPGT